MANNFMKFTPYILVLILGLLLFLDYYSIQDLCVGPSCRSVLNAVFFGWFVFSIISLVFYISVSILPKKYFVSWWKFARFAIPLIFIVITIINLQLHHTPGGWMNMDHAFDRLFTWMIFILFTLGALSQIIRGYWSKGV